MIGKGETRRVIDNGSDPDFQLLPVRDGSGLSPGYTSSFSVVSSGPLVFPLPLSLT